MSFAAHHVPAARCLLGAGLSLCARRLLCLAARAYGPEVPQGHLLAATARCLGRA